jgi:hypothetical protein
LFLYFDSCSRSLSVLSLILANPPASDLADVYKNKAETPFAASRATLVIGPNHLAAQWMDEITKNTSPPLKVIYIPTIVQLRSKTFVDLMEAGTREIQTVVRSRKKKENRECLRYRRARKAKHTLMLSLSDVVITTYNVLKSDKYGASPHWLVERRKGFAEELKTSLSPRLFEWSRLVSREKESLPPSSHVTEPSPSLTGPPVVRDDPLASHCAR